MSSDSFAPAVDSLIAELQRLRLQLADHPTTTLDSTQSSDSFELVDPIEPGPCDRAPAAKSRPARIPLAGPRAVVFSPEWDAALFQATTPGELLAIDLSPVDHLVREAHLKTFGDWTPAARIALAYRAGRAARLDLLGFTPGAQVVTAPLPRNTIFVCLVCENYPQGFWTTSSDQFRNLSQLPWGPSAPERFLRGGFPSRIEAAAYLAGADRTWPARLNLGRQTASGSHRR